MQIGIGYAGLLQLRNFEDLKKYAMIFERVRIIGLKEFLSSKAPCGSELERQIYDLEYLQDKEFLSHAIYTSEESSIFHINEEQRNKFQFIREALCRCFR
jgi:hypothetical protein